MAFAGFYAYGTAKYRRAAARRLEFVDPPVPGTPEFGRLVEALCGAPLRKGNRVEILLNGEQTFPPMLAAISAANETIDFSSYIFWPGEITTSFTEAFIERARAGVEVNFIVDGWGSAKLDHDQVQALKDAGVNVAVFRSPHWYTLHKLNNRMHRRLLIVDGRLSFAGGVGIADEWLGNAEDPDHWRETHVRLEGPAVRDLVGGFLENWVEATGRGLAPRHFPEIEEIEAGDGGIDVHVTRSTARSGGAVSQQLFFAVIGGAVKRLWLTTAYFAPGPAFVDAFCEAARRGVDVRILVNGPNIDKGVVRRAAQRCYGRLLESGVRMFEYQPTMLHAKVLIADQWANVGSSNLDERSLGLDDEINVDFHDPAVVSKLSDQFLADLDVSEEFELSRWRERPLAKRVREHAADLLRQSF